MSDKLILKSINELLGENFYIPHYQRGYRWSKQQVTDLLNDIWAFTLKPNKKDSEFYCLQPIVVKQKNWNELGTILNGFEVIDGQQRLTTIYIIIKYIASEFLKVDTLIEDYGKDLYTLRYETRPGSEIFLKQIVEDRSNMDFYYISEAYKTIREWFSSTNNTKDRTDKNKFLSTLLGKKTDERSVQIIWYLVDSQANSIELFTRLNVGKIPLTNAELIKALFLSSASFANEIHDDAVRKKMEISQMWDDIEHKLSEEDARFWSFVSNASRDEYATKIELLFDVMAEKGKEEIDPLFTFLHFLRRSKDSTTPLWMVWLSIEQYYLTLCEWFRDKNLYHKVGYLVAIGERLKVLVDLSLTESKDTFERKLDERIKKSINYPVEELSFEKSGDYKKIEKVLVLLNIESIRVNKSISEFYPFHFHKGVQWSLEHIHAQQSDVLGKTKQDPWFKWLSYHTQLIEELINNDNSPSLDNWKRILVDIKTFNNENLTWEKFNSLSNEIIAMFSENIADHEDQVHRIANLALLSQPNNSALNNSVFEVKRREIIRMDKEGDYIPICTRRVFFEIL